VPRHRQPVGDRHRAGRLADARAARVRRDRRRARGPPRLRPDAVGPCARQPRCAPAPHLAAQPRRPAARGGPRAPHDPPRRPRPRPGLRSRADELLAAGPGLDMIGLAAEDLGGYEHLELAPLINARAHRLGPKLQILNDGLAAQYPRFLELVAHRRAPTAEDLLAAAHYLLAQDRPAPALAALARVDPSAVVDVRSEVAGRGDPDGSAGGAGGRGPRGIDVLQYHYLAGYAACLAGDLGRAREAAARWRDHPVDRW